MKITPDPTHPSGINSALEEDDIAAGKTVAYLAGPLIQGTIVLPDGSAYDVTPAAIAVKPEHVNALHTAIHKAHHAAGRFLDVPVPDEADYPPLA